MPPTSNLGRRKLSEDGVRGKVEDVAAHIPVDSALLICGDFNARTSTCTPVWEGATHATRTSADNLICARGQWLIE